MGYAYNELVAPAVLFRNPSITREEFVKLLGETHTSGHYGYNPEQAWDYYDSESEEERYHQGLEGLAHILRLPNTEQFCKFQESKVDDNGLFVRAPYVLPAREGADYKFKVVVHKRNIIGKPRTMKKEYCWGRLKPGEVWEDWTGAEWGLVTQVIEERFIGKEDQEDSEFPEEPDSPTYESDFIMMPFRSSWKVHKYKSKERLHRSWPIFHPDNAFDWNTSSGSFYLGPYFNTDTFRWKKKGTRYFIDESTFDLIPASMNCAGSIGLGYTDLILTAEAIKHNAWKLISYKGRAHFQDFLKDFPDSRAEYERAVWDSHTSLSAKLQGLSVSDFLRFRMLRD